jgi:cytochrome c1
MSKTKRKFPDVHYEMVEIFKRKSGPHIKKISRQKEKQNWKREFDIEVEQEHKDIINYLKWLEMGGF